MVTKIGKLKELFPDLNRNSIVPILREENNNMEAVVSRILEESEKVQEESTRAEHEEEDHQETSVITMAENVEKLDELCAVSVDTSVLRSILSNVSAQEKSALNNPRVLAFNKHSPASSLIKQSINKDALALTSWSSPQHSNHDVYCFPCTNVISNNIYNFCPYCGKILKKNYRRL